MSIITSIVGSKFIFKNIVFDTFNFDVKTYKFHGK